MSVGICVHSDINTKCLAITQCSNKWQVVLGREQLSLSWAWEDCRLAAASLLEVASAWAVGLVRAHLVWTRVREGFLVEEAIGGGKVGSFLRAVMLEGPAGKVLDAPHYRPSRFPSPHHGDEHSHFIGAVASSERGQPTAAFSGSLRSPRLGRFSVKPLPPPPAISPLQKRGDLFPAWKSSASPIFRISVWGPSEPLLGIGLPLFQPPSCTPDWPNRFWGRGAGSRHVETAACPPARFPPPSPPPSLPHTIPGILHCPAQGPC